MKIKLLLLFIVFFYLNHTNAQDIQLVNKIVGNTDPTNYYIGHFPVSGSDGLDLHWYGGIRFGDGYNTSVMQITNGKVGIGTTAPSYNFEVISQDVYGNNVFFGNNSGLLFQQNTNIYDIIGYNKSSYNKIRLRAGSFSSDQLVLDTNGYIGIGTQNPIGKFDVRGNVFIGTTDLSIGSVGSFVQIDQGLSTGNSYSQIRAYSNGGNINNHLVLQSTGGNVGIGSTNPDQKLTVKGKIHAEEIIVDLAVPADYVFQKYYTGKSTLKSDYVMPTLAEIESFTKKNHHLPNVPSAQEVQQNGVSLGTMSNVLLQKVEELTLYAIEQQKKLDEQNKTIAVLASRLESLEKK